MDARDELLQGLRAAGADAGIELQGLELIQVQHRVRAIRVDHQIQGQIPPANGTIGKGGREAQVAVPALDGRGSLSMHLKDVEPAI